MDSYKSVLGLAAAFSFAFAPQAWSQSSDPAWLDDLSDQLAIEQACAVEYYVNIREGELGGRDTYEARAQCRDGRQFDASRIEPEPLFTIEACGVQVC